MIIGGNRYCGKTTELIKASSEGNIPILCCNYYNSKHIIDLAKEMGLEIPKPITVRDLEINPTLRDGKGVLVDEAIDILQILIGKKVLMASVSDELKNLETL